MVSLPRFEPREIPEGTPVTILVSTKLGPKACIPLHALPDLAASSILFEFFGTTEQSRRLWGRLTDGRYFDPRNEPSLRQMVYLVGEETGLEMEYLLSLGPKHPVEFPPGVEFIYLHG